MVACLELADYLLIAEQILGVSASELARLDRIGLADAALNAPSVSFGGKGLYPRFEAKAAVLCWHLLRNHPLPDGNKRAAFLSLVEFVRRSGHEWRRGQSDPAETDAVIRAAAAGECGVDAAERLDRVEDLVSPLLIRIRPSRALA